MTDKPVTCPACGSRAKPFGDSYICGNHNCNLWGKPIDGKPDQTLVRVADALERIACSLEGIEDRK